MKDDPKFVCCMECHYAFGYKTQNPCRNCLDGVNFSKATAMELLHLQRKKGKHTINNYDFVSNNQLEFF